MIYGIVLFDTEDENEIEHVAIAKSNPETRTSHFKSIVLIFFNHGYAKVCYREIISRSLLVSLRNQLNSRAVN